MNIYSSAIQEVKRARDWKMPHFHAVYPVNRYRVDISTPELRKGHKILTSVLCYLETCARIEMGEKQRTLYKGVDLRKVINRNAPEAYEVTNRM